MGKKAELEKLVWRKIHILQSEAQSGGGKAAMANLRRGIGREPGELPELLGILLSDMPQEFWSENGTATKEEWVCYTVLTLYALHQQGHDAKGHPMNTDDEVSMGRALYKLAEAYDGDPNGEQRIVQKLRTLATAKDRKELSHHLRGIVQLLKGNGIPLNYKRLAGDLYGMQFPEGKRQVCLRWGQDFYGEKNKKEDKEDKSGEEKSI